jgi:hypothetical protein
MRWAKRLWRWLTEPPVDENGDEIPLIRVTITEQATWEDRPS